MIMIMIIKMRMRMIMRIQQYYFGGGGGGGNFEEHLFSEMYSLMEQLFESLWLLISVAAALCFHGY